MLGKYYCKSFNRKRDAYPWGTLTCDIFSPDFSCLPNTVTRIWGIHTNWTCTHTPAHTHKLSGVFADSLHRTHNMDAQNSLPTEWQRWQSQQSSVWLSAKWLPKGRQFRLAFVWTQTICPLKIEPGLYMKTYLSLDLCRCWYSLLTLLHTTLYYKRTKVGADVWGFHTRGQVQMSILVIMEVIPPSSSLSPVRLWGKYEKLQKCNQSWHFKVYFHAPWCITACTDGYSLPGYKFWICR